MLCKKRVGRNRVVGRRVPRPTIIKTDLHDWNKWLLFVKNWLKNSSISSSFSHPRTDNRPYINVNIFDEVISALFDSGANTTIIGKSGLYLINKYDLYINKRHSFVSLRTADGSSQSILGTVDLPISVDGVTKYLTALVSDSVTPCLTLGVDFCYLFGIKTDFSTDSFSILASLNSALAIRSADDLDSVQQQQLAGIINLFRELDRPELGRTTKVLHKIDTGDVEPLKQRYYPLSPAMLEHVNREVDEMLSLGIIRESSSPWNSPLVMVKKKSGEFRVCFDAKKLNKVTKKDAYPLPFLTDILDRLRDARYLTSIDLKKAFWQIPLHPDSCEKTAFTVPRRGLFEYVVMPMGISNAPSTLQRLMDSILGHVLGQSVFVYLDDIIVVSSTFKEHISILTEVYSRLKEANLTINLNKCEFCKPSLTYLGYVVDKDGLHTDPQKVSTIVNYPQPKTVTEIKRFLGMASWYRRFVNDFSTIVAPISDLTKGKKKSQCVQWTDEAVESFSKIKSLLVSAPILASPDFSKIFSIQCDASGYGVGGVLTQGVGEEECVVAYASRTLNKAERNYSATERELLAVIFCIQKFRPYIEGTHFKVITDHHSLIWLQNIKDPTGRLARWCVKLQQFDFEVIHRKGKHHVVPDALSRSPLEINSLELAQDDFEPWYLNMIDKVINFPDKYPDWKVEQGKLFKFIPNNHNVISNLIQWKLVVPKSRRLELFKECHDDPTSSHLGVFKTFSKLSEQYYWPKMRADVHRYVRRCDVCLQSKSAAFNHYGFMGKSKSVTFPFQCLSIDLVGPFPRSKNGNTSLLVICDWFTKFTIIHPMKKATARSICQFIENHVFLVFGVCQICMVDNGPQFRSSQFRKLLERYQVPKVWFNASYHPQVNFVERVNRVVVTAIRSYVKDNHKDWDVEIHKIAHALRNAVHEVTGFTPSFLAFGRTVPISGDYYGKLDDLDPQDLTIDSREKIVNDVNELSPIFHDVKQRLKLAYERSSQRYNLRRRPLKFKVHDIVWKRNFVLSDASKNFSQKLAPKYVKCKVAEITGATTYRLVSLDNKPLGIFHVQDLKPHCPSDDEGAE